MEQIQILTNDKFKEIYTDDKLRHEVAYAHSVCNASGEREYLKALMYPISYKVTEEQKQEALKVLKQEEQKILIENKNNLLFCEMGMRFNSELLNGIGNHRIRTHFINDDGKECFIEIGTKCDKVIKKRRIKDNNLRVDFAIIDYGTDKQKYNFMELEYTLTNVLNLVNNYFNCSFKKIVLDYYHISCNSVLCISPMLK